MTTISVIIPLYNAEAYILKAIKSVLRQTHPCHEIIVVDDGSTDKSVQVLRSLRDARLRLLQQENKGAAAARNFGVSQASGAFISFLDADDIWMPNKLDLQMERFASGGKDLIFGMMVEFLSPDCAKKLEGRVAVSETPRVGIASSTLFMRRDDFARVGAQDETLRVGEFIDWYARAQDEGLETDVVPKIVARRRIHLENFHRQNATRHLEYARVMRTILYRRRGLS